MGNISCIVHQQNTALHLAFICPPFRSHIHVFEALANELVRRGHRASFVLNEGAEHSLRSPHPVFTAKGTSRSTLDRILRRAARPTGLFGVLRTVSDTAALTDRLCREGPAILRSLGVDAVIGDQMEPAAGLIARHLHLPMLSIACALPVERDPTVPLPFLSWPYGTDAKAIKRNKGGETIADLLLTAQRKTISRWSAHLDLSPPAADLQDCLSPLGTIAQIAAELDFPRTATERPLHYVGPVREQNAVLDLPFDIDPNKPFVFMSLGTLQGHRFRLFRTVARACTALGAQLLVAHCGGLSKAEAKLIGATWVTDFAPQRTVLQRADLCVTHGGMNTVMDALEFGKPMLVLPIAFDQPGVAARVVHHGVGVALSHRFLTVSKAEVALRRLLEDEEMRRRAAELGCSVRQAGGLRLAADIIEAKLVGRPTLEARQGAG